MRRAALPLAALLLLWPLGSQGFKFLSFDWVWPSASVAFSAGSLGAPFDQALLDAATEWNDATKFHFEIDFRSVGACDGGRVELGAEFAPSTCSGSPLDGTILAVTEFEVRGGEMYAGVTFNSSESWSVYEGPWRSASSDLRRTALHELGHVLGLGHESNAPAIMAPFIQDRDALQLDDIAGASALYGGTLPAELRCERNQLRAAGRLCQRSLRCEARARDGAARPDAAGRLAACRARAEQRFADAWLRAFRRADHARGACHQTADATSAAAPILDGSLDIADAVGAADPGDRHDAALRGRLLRRVAALCRQDLTAHRRNVVGDNPAALARRLDAARARFLKRSGRVIDGFARRGALYDGGDPALIAADTEALAADAAANAAGD